ncbi:MAG: L-threonylcarbamoyladenylate synthase, partial [Actinomycetota bacterium]
RGPCRTAEGPGGIPPVGEVVRCNDPGVLARVVEALESGAVIILPTDTVYGVAAALSHPGAVRRIFQMKRRPRSKPLPVLVGSLEQAGRLGLFEGRALKAAEEGWPGPVTLVVPSVLDLSVLGGDGKSVGLRVPNHRFALEVLKLAGPLAATSANISGKETPSTIDDIRADLGDDVDFYVDDGILAKAPSSVISLIGPPRKLR